MKWKTKIGEVINIGDMTDNHLKNSILYLKRNAENYVLQNQNFYMTCALPNGEIANDCFDKEFDEVMELTADDLLSEHKGYKALLKEANRRNLTL